MMLSVTIEVCWGLFLYKKQQPCNSLLFAVFLVLFVFLLFLSVCLFTWVPSLESDQIKNKTAQKNPYKIADLNLKSKSEFKMIFTFY